MLVLQERPSLFEPKRVGPGRSYPLISTRPASATWVCAFNGAARMRRLSSTPNRWRCICVRRFHRNTNSSLIVIVITSPSRPLTLSPEMQNSLCQSAVGWPSYEDDTNTKDGRLRRPLVGQSTDRKDQSAGELHALYTTNDNTLNN